MNSKIEMITTSQDILKEMKISPLFPKDMNVWLEHWIKFLSDDPTSIVFSPWALGGGSFVGSAVLQVTRCSDFPLLIILRFRLSMVSGMLTPGLMSIWAIGPLFRAFSRDSSSSDFGRSLLLFLFCSASIPVQFSYASAQRLSLISPSPLGIQDITVLELGQQKCHGEFSFHFIYSV
jgi:hypothetical protein